MYLQCKTSSIFPTSSKISYTYEYMYEYVGGGDGSMVGYVCKSKNGVVPSLGQCQSGMNKGTTL